MLSTALIILVTQIVGGLLAFIGGIMFIIRAFKVSTTWGLLVLFVPFAAFVFL
ncbi:MAG: hypothetical protein HGA86_05390, partial [Anaerolineaceae bacterium]|nr:hypothetical protein [Anaerolineaceae bacterium]